MKAAVIKNSAKSIERIPIVLKENGVESDVLLHTEAAPKIENRYDFIVLSGGTLDFRKPEFDGEKELLLKTVKPVFGICMGFQLTCKMHGVDLILLDEKAEGMQEVDVAGLDRLGMDFPDGKMKVRQNHRCAIPRCPDGFTQYGSSPNGVEMIVHNSRPLWATQFHPEYEGENEGRLVLDRFVQMVKEGLL